jgi:hypothetical protein
MKKNSCLAAIGACCIALSSCATKITGSTDTTVAVGTTTTTIATPKGTILELINQLIPAANGLGEAIVENNSEIYKQKVAQADAIWDELKPQIIESKIDVVENMQSIIDLFHSAVERKRPADADKALRFLPLVEEAIAPLLK